MQYKQQKFKWVKRNKQLNAQLKKLYPIQFDNEDTPEQNLNTDSYEFSQTGIVGFLQSVDEKTRDFRKNPKKD